jgi:sporulation protein YlmC with PRC-barrel domain
MNDYNDETAYTDKTALSHGGLIAASRVNGTTVYDTSGTKIGTIDDLMIDKLSGNTRYAVMSFGGFLGIGDKYHPLPWNTLKYDPNLAGYVVNVSREQLEGGPAYTATDTRTWDDDAYGQRLDDYYTARRI